MPELLNKTFQSTDTLLAEKRVHAGCTAVVAFMRTEVRNLRQRLNNPYSAEEEGQVFASSNEQTSASINDVAAAAGDVKPPAATEVELKEGEDDDSHTQECVRGKRVIYVSR